jgi:hypothetical protein
MLPERGGAGRIPKAKGEVRIPFARRHGFLLVEVYVIILTVKGVARDRTLVSLDKGKKARWGGRWTKGLLPARLVMDQVHRRININDRR